MPKKQNWATSSGNWLAGLYLDSRAGAAKVKRDKQDVYLNTLPLEFEVDTEQLQTRKCRIGPGVYQDRGAWFEGQDLEDDEKIQVKLPIFSDQKLPALGDEPLGLRELASTAYAVRDAFNLLEQEAFLASDPPPDSVMAVRLEGFEDVTYGKGSSKRPILKFVEWRPRRAEFVDLAEANGVELDRSGAFNDAVPELGGDEIEV